ncbi:MAG: beta-ketoacyl synthase chain length factor [Mariprofundaceae bacterium]|nr:beta-ketoacyl synthase chain length factor [Mariprofundaceae bacterium]
MSNSLLAVLGCGISFQSADIAQALAYENADMKTDLLPANLRRRTSVATKMAFAAAQRACESAAVKPSELSVIFTSALGEAAITDQLCRDIARQDFPLSPTKFHNSVHNTASGYWSIAVGSQHPAMAMAGYKDGFALALLEAWSQLHTIEKQILLVCYEETPSDLLLPDNQWVACATAFVLSSKGRNGLSLHMPYCITDATKSDQLDDKKHSPALAALPLYDALTQGNSGTIQISPESDQTWFIEVTNAHA